MTAAQVVGAVASWGARARRALRPSASEVLLTVSGASRDVLRDAPRERTKQVAMGAVIASTALVAAVSAAYAFRVALHLPVVVAVLAGAVWGLIILNLDRWLVVSTPRLKTWWGTVAMALPRVVLAVLIGTVISTPLTLAVFGAEIGTELKVMAAQEEDAFTKQLAADSRYADLPAERAKIEELQASLAQGLGPDAVAQDPAVVDVQRRLDAVTSQFTAAEQAVTCEKDGTCGSGTPGAGIAFAEKVAIRDRLAAERDTLTQQLATTTQQVQQQLQDEQVRTAADQRAQLAALQRQVDRTQRQQDAEVAAHRAAVGSSDGLLARLAALGRIQSGHPELALAHLLLFALVTALECLPIIFKTMLALAPPSLYERLAALEEQRAEARVRLRMQTEYEEAETLARSVLAAAEARAARTLEAESRATGLVLDAQLAVTRESVQRWREEQLAGLRPSQDTGVDTFDLTELQEDARSRG